MPEIQMPKLSDTMTEAHLVRGKRRRATTFRPAKCWPRSRPTRRRWNGSRPKDGTLAEFMSKKAQGNVRRQDRVHRWSRAGSAKEEERERKKSEVEGEQGRREARRVKAKEREPKRRAKKEPEKKGDRRRKRRRNLWRQAWSPATNAAAPQPQKRP